MNIGQSISSLAQRLLNTTGIWSPEEDFQGSPVQSLILDEDMVVLSSPAPISVPGSSPRSSPWTRDALAQPSAGSPRSSLTFSLSSSLTWSEGSGSGSDEGSPPSDGFGLRRMASHSDDQAAPPPPTADSTAAAAPTSPPAAAVPGSAATSYFSAMRMPPPRFPLSAAVMPMVANATSLAERRSLSATLSEPYARLVCNIDAIAVMGARHELGLSTESPERLGNVIMATAKRLGIIRAIDSIRATDLSLQTLRERAALVTGASGGETLAAETEFCLSFAWGAAFGDDRAQRQDASEGKRALAEQLCELIPGDARRLGAERRRQGVEFVARYVPYATLQVLQGYQESPEGRRFTAESRRAEPQVVGLFRAPGAQWAIDHACRNAFEDWREGR